MKLLFNKSGQDLGGMMPRAGLFISIVTHSGDVAAFFRAGLL